jgi:hypothetical protein
MRHIKTILSLCDYTGVWSQPYRDAGYNVIQVDIEYGQDVRLLPYPDQIHGLIMQPPCTHLASSGARWWRRKGDAALLEALAIVDACLRFVAVSRPVWWVLENPVGRLSRYLGPANYIFDPCDFGDPYTKRTCLWGTFTPPFPLFVGENRSVVPVEGSKMHKLPPSSDRAALRSVTPAGFARAFFEVNP